MAWSHHGAAGRRGILHREEGAEGRRRGEEREEGREGEVSGAGTSHYQLNPSWKTARRESELRVAQAEEDLSLPTFSFFFFFFFLFLKKNTHGRTQLAAMARRSGSGECVLAARRRCVSGEPRPSVPVRRGLC